MKMIVAGKTDETLVTIIRKNVRTPDQTMGDLLGPGRGARSDGGPAARADGGYGLPISPTSPRIQGRWRNGHARAIGELPDGTYRAGQTDGLDGQADHAQDGAHHQGRRDRDGFCGTDRQVDAPSTAPFATPTPWRCTG
jgi:N-methylhydantoinase B